MESLEMVAEKENRSTITVRMLMVVAMLASSSQAPKTKSSTKVSSQPFATKEDKMAIVTHVDIA